MNNEERKPTREEIATRLEAVNVSIDPNWRVGTVDKDYEADRNAIDAATAVLRQTCAGCQHFIRYEGYTSGESSHPPTASCMSWRGPVSPDGSGFCDRFTPAVRVE